METGDIVGDNSSEKKYGTFVVDPPWHYGNKSTRNAAAKHYDTMSIEEICDLSIVPDTAADKSHLYLWVTSSHLPQGFDVMKAWGFDYKTYLVWNKPQMGMETTSAYALSLFCSGSGAVYEPRGVTCGTTSQLAVVSILRSRQIFWTWWQALVRDRILKCSPLLEDPRCG
jgi:hypothetical protein